MPTGADFRTSSASSLRNAQKVRRHWLAAANDAARMAREPFSQHSPATTNHDETGKKYENRKSRKRRMCTKICYLCATTIDVLPYRIWTGSLSTGGHLTCTLANMPWPKTAAAHSLVFLRWWSTLPMICSMLCVITVPAATANHLRARCPHRSVRLWLPSGNIQIIYLNIILSIMASWA